MRILKFLPIIVLAFMANVSSAQGLGPDRGEMLPHDLSMMATSGKIENHNSLTGDKGTAIFFVRSFDWCPYCQKQAIEVNERAADFVKRGVNPVFISYDTPEIQKNFSDKWNFTVPILSDAGSKVIKEFGVLNDSASPDSRLYGYPHPLVFLVSPDGVIRDKLYIESDTVVNGSNYKDRPEVDVILAAIDKM